MGEPLAVSSSVGRGGGAGNSEVRQFELGLRGLFLDICYNWAYLHLVSSDHMQNRKGMGRPYHW